MQFESKCSKERGKEFAGDIGVFRQFMDGILMSEEFMGSFSKVGEIGGSINALWKAEQTSSQ